MRHPLEQARVLLRKAAEDAHCMARLIEPPAVMDASIGFHAQQAVEKALKAVILSRGADFAYTHNLKTLARQMRGLNLPQPPHADLFGPLTPFAAEFRYDDPDPMGGLDWPVVRAQVEDILAWARAQVDAGEVG